MASAAKARSSTNRGQPAGKQTFTDRIERVGCFVIGIYALALFFGLGAFISFLNRDLMTALQGGLLAGGSVALGVWLARRRG